MELYCFCDIKREGDYLIFGNAEHELARLISEYCQIISYTRVSIKSQSVSILVSTMKDIFFKLKEKSWVVKFCDIFFASFILLPLVVIYWFTSWELCDIYISPENLTVSAAISFSIGFIGQFISMYYQAVFESLGNFVKMKFLRILIAKFYSLLFALTSISFWRGAWMFADILSSNSNFELWTSLIQNSLILMLLKAFRNTLSSPFVTITDDKENVFSIETHFDRKVKILMSEN